MEGGGAALPALPRSGMPDRIGNATCDACEESIGCEHPAVVEYLVDQRVEAVLLTPGGCSEPPLSVCRVGSFHARCYALLVDQVELDDGVRYVGTCPLSKQSISAPRPLSRCPICASPIRLVKMHAAIGQVV